MAAVAIAASGYWWGLSSLWNGIAFLMIGLLVAALVLPARRLEGVGWAESLGEVVRLRRFWVPGARLDLDQHLLALPGELAPHLLRRGPQAGRVRRPDPQPHGVVALQETDSKYIASGLLVALTFLAADVGNLGGGPCPDTSRAGG